MMLFTKLHQLVNQLLLKQKQLVNPPVHHQKLVYGVNISTNLIYPLSQPHQSQLPVLLAHQAIQS